MLKIRHLCNPCVQGRVFKMLEITILAPNASVSLLVTRTPHFTAVQWSMQLRQDAASPWQHSAASFLEPAAIAGAAAQRQPCHQQLPWQFLA